jgi:hypothetical protein
MPTRKPPPEPDMRANINLSVQDILDRIELEQARQRRKINRHDDELKAVRAALQGKLTEEK